MVDCGHDVLGEDLAFRVGKILITFRTVPIFDITVLEAGRRYFVVMSKVVTCCGNDCLLQQNFATHNAMRSLGKSRLGATRRNCFIYDLGVSRGLYRRSLLFTTQTTTNHRTIAGAGGFFFYEPCAK